MIDNVIFNRSDGTFFNLDQENNRLEWYNESTPIWITNEKEGHKSGVLFWPGYKVPYDGIKPSYLPPKKYRAPYIHNNRPGMLLDKREDMAIDWLKDSNVTFVAFYCERLDGVSHDHSPDSKKQKHADAMEEAMKKVDKMIGSLVKKLKKNNLYENTNIIIMGKCIYTDMGQ